jgi:hypothetical protein
VDFVRSRLGARFSSPCCRPVPVISARRWYASSTT